MIFKPLLLQSSNIAEVINLYAFLPLEVSISVSSMYSWLKACGSERRQPAISQVVNYMSPVTIKFSITQTLGGIACAVGWITTLIQIPAAVMV